jgi:hypothetical protein
MQQQQSVKRPNIQTSKCPNVQKQEKQCMSEQQFASSTNIDAWPQDNLSKGLLKPALVLIPCAACI